MKAAVRYVLMAATVVLATTRCAPEAGSVRPARPSVKPGEFGTADCFLRRSVHDFVVLDDRNLIVLAPGASDGYHVQVSPPASELRFANVLAFESRNTRICGYAGDSLVIGDPGSRPFRMSVTGVYRLDDIALAGLMSRFGKGSPPPAPAPQPGEGAEIEREIEAPATP